MTEMGMVTVCYLMVNAPETGQRSERRQKNDVQQLWRLFKNSLMWDLMDAFFLGVELIPSMRRRHRRIFSFVISFTQFMYIRFPHLLLPCLLI